MVSSHPCDLHPNAPLYADLYTVYHPVAQSQSRMTFWLLFEGLFGAKLHAAPLLVGRAPSQSIICC